MRAILLAVPMLFVSSAGAVPAANDQDTVCATVYTYLSQAARASGVTSAGFDTGADRAQSNHMVQNPGEDSQRYTLRVIDGAQSIRDAMVRGTISSESLVNTATTCNVRYFAESGG